MTFDLSMGEVVAPYPQMNLRDMKILTAACDALFAEEPPSYETLIAAKRDKVAKRLDDRTKYLSLQAQISAAQ